MGCSQLINACHGSSTIWKKLLYVSHDPLQFIWDLEWMDFNSRAFWMSVFFCVNPWSSCWSFFYNMSLPMHWCINVKIQITFVTSGYCSLFDTVKRIFVHHCRSDITTFANLVNVSKLLFAFFNPKVLHLSSSR